MPEGLSYYYFENGRKKQANTYHTINSKQGIRDGGDTTWYDNGQLNMITNYRQGKRVGYTVRYAEKGNMLMSGYYKNDERDSVWVTYNDNKSIKSTSNYVNGMQQLPLSDIPCQCYDSTKVKLGFAPLLTSLAEWETVKQWSYNFHAPIDSFYEHLFYSNLQTDNNRDASFYSFRLIAFKPIYLKVPNETGLKLIFNPCRNLFNGESFIDFYVSLQTDDKSATRATLEAKKINLEFNSSVLHLWNSKKQTAFRNDNNEYLTSPILLGTSSVSYNAEEQLKIEKIKDVCFPLSEIMQSGILVSMNQLEIDLNTVKNEYAYQSFRDQRELANNPNKSARGEGSYERGYFIGIYSKDATLTLPRQLFNDQEFPLTIKPDVLAISNEEVTGKFRLKVKPLTGEEYLYEGAKDKLKWSPEILKNTFTKLGFRHVAVEFDVQSSELIVYF
jgi:hypothetical protein